MTERDKSIATLLIAAVMCLVIWLALDDAHNRAALQILRAQVLREREQIRSTASGGGKNNWSVTCYADGGIKVGKTGDASPEGGEQQP
jgi:hypothetical protein